MLLAATAFVAIGPIFLGTIELGNQTAGNLTGIGRFLGSVVVVGGILYFMAATSQQTPQRSLAHSPGGHSAPRRLLRIGPGQHPLRHHHTLGLAPRRCGWPRL